MERICIGNEEFIHLLEYECVMVIRSCTDVGKELASEIHLTLCNHDGDNSQQEWEREEGIVMVV